MAEYIKAQSRQSVSYGAEYDATALSNLVNETTRPSIKSYFRTDEMITTTTEEVFIKYKVDDAGSYEWSVDSSPKVTGVTANTHTDRFQISVYTYLGDEWLKIYARDDLPIGTYVLKYGLNHPNIIYHGIYDNFRYVADSSRQANANIIIGSKTYIQIEPTITASEINDDDIWDWQDGGSIVEDDDGNYSGFVDIGSFSAWLNNKDEF